MNSELLTQLCSASKFDRDRGIAQLESWLATANASEAATLVEAHLLTALEDPSKPWEVKLGALLGCRVVIPRLRLESDDVDGGVGIGGSVFVHSAGDAIILRVETLLIRLLSDPEVRVRLAAGEILGSLCRRFGVDVYRRQKDVLLDLVRANMDRQIASEESMASSSDHSDKEKQNDQSMTAAEVISTTSGWKFLGTSMKTLQDVIEGCGCSFVEYADEELLDLVFKTLVNPNYVVRETGFFVMAALFGCQESNPGEVDSVVIENYPISSRGSQLCHYLGKGLADSWSQVRLAASVATRKFLLSFPDDSSREAFFPELVPRMCLNRYYVADGVRNYSQETWRKVMDTRGRYYVKKHIKDVVAYYASQTKAENHAVREASCSCIAELAAKIDQEAIQPFVPHLLETLLMCFQDESWPVRDAACMACGNFILCYPEESKSSMDTLYTLFFMNLEDNIPSVRQGAAVSLANTVKAYGEVAMATIVPKVQEGLKAVDRQPSETEKHTHFQPATSCDPLKSQTGHVTLCGCLDRTFKRQIQPWEITEGCVFLIAELSAIPVAAPHVCKLLPQLAEATSKKHYAHHTILLETVCAKLPAIAKGLGKKAYKPFIDSFLYPVFYSLNCENAAASSAASYCLNQLSAFIGPNILRGRVEQFVPNYLDQFDANAHIAPF